MCSSDLYAQAKEDKREEVPVSKLRVGLKCGGSDGFSGIIIEISMPKSRIRNGSRM